MQLSGTTSDVEAGQTITVIFGGKATPPRLPRAAPGLTIPATDLATLPDGAANVGPASATSQVTAPGQRMLTASMPPRHPLPSTPSPATIFLTPPKRDRR
ncbi:hypothetical protein FA039_04895 [Escherichia coli]|nr:hypothetical protein [Escherichia coli]